MRSQRCSSGCQINPKGVADECLSTSANQTQEIITDPSEDPVIPVNEPYIMNQVVCGPMDGNKNGTIDRGDLGYMAMVYSTLTLSKQCTDKNVDYPAFGGMDSNKDGVVDSIDLTAFVKAFNK